MDRRGDGVPVIRERSRELSGCLPDYEMIDGSELRLVIWAGGGRPGSAALIGSTSRR